jgi:hypothetical protein
MNEHVDTAPLTDGGEEGFDWMMVEIFGHRTHYGRGKEVERFGSKMLRIDIPTVEWTKPEAEGEQPKPVITGWTTLFYGGAAIFSNGLCDEGIVIQRNAPYRSPYRATLPARREEDETDDEDEPVF